MANVITTDQEMRIMAYANGSLLANCEECGQPIPVELSKCMECAHKQEFELNASK